VPVDVLEDARREFRSLRRLAERALDQVSERDFFATLDPEANSVAVLVKHLGGNLRSRWTDFLASDGEKPDRRRDAEFEIVPADTRASLMDRWEAGWQALSDTLESLSAADLEREVTIRGEPHTVVKAIHRALAHAGVHIGQIVLLAKHWAGSGWKTLSIPRGQSEEFTRRLGERSKGAK
jgi:hypothetical protein